MQNSMITLWNEGVSILEVHRLPNFANYALGSGRRGLLLHPVSDPKNHLAKLSSEEREDLYHIVFLEREEAKMQELSGFQQSVLAMSATLVQLSGIAHEDGNWSQDDETVFGDDDDPSWDFSAMSSPTADESLALEESSSANDSATPADATKAAWSFGGKKQVIDVAGTDIVSQAKLSPTSHARSPKGAKKTPEKVKFEKPEEALNLKSQTAVVTGTGAEQPYLEEQAEVIASARPEKPRKILPGGGTASSLVEEFEEPILAQSEDDNESVPQPDVVILLEAYGIRSPNEPLEDFPGRRVQFGNEVKIREYIKGSVPDARHVNRASRMFFKTPSGPSQPSRPVLRIRPPRSSPPPNNNAEWLDECEEDLKVLDRTLPVVGATNDHFSIGYTRDAIRNAKIAIIDARHLGSVNPDAVVNAVRVTETAHKFHEETLRRVNWKSNRAHFEEFKRAVANLEQGTYHAHTEEISRQPVDYYDDLQES
jgi:hypothetical protein